jgi:hypothetical protein
VNYILVCIVPTSPVLFVVYLDYIPSSGRITDT